MNEIGGDTQITGSLFGLETHHPPLGFHKLRSDRHWKSSDLRIVLGEFPSPAERQTFREGGTTCAFRVSLPVESEQSIVMSRIVVTMTIHCGPIRRLSIKLGQE